MRGSEDIEEDIEEEAEQESEDDWESRSRTNEFGELSIRQQF